MRRLVILIGVLALALVGLVASLPFLVSTETVRSAILERLTELTGREVSFRGSPKVLFSPFLAIEISDLLISDRSDNPEEDSLLSAERVQAQLEIIPALLGDVSLNKFRLVRPRLNLRVKPDGSTSWQFDKGQLFEAYDSTAKSIEDEENTTRISSTRLGDFTIVDGAILYEDSTAGSTQEVTSINGVINWPQTNTGAQVEGLGIWRGENINFESRFEKPMTLMGGGESALSVTVSSTPINLEFEGMANMFSNLFFSGRLQLSTPSTNRLSEILETRIGNFGSLSLIGDVEATSSTMRLTEAAVEISENAATGVLSISFDELGDSKINGTLAFDELDFSSLISDGQSQTENQISDPERKTSIDLRVSANSINAGFTQLEEVAAIVTADEQGWTLDIGDAKAFGGGLIAKFGESVVEDKKQAFLDAAATDVDAGSLSSLLSETRFTINGTARIDANVRGKDFASLLARQGVSGTIEAKLENANIDGIDLPGLLASLKSDESDQGVQSLPAGNTNAEEFSISLFLTDSIANIGVASLVSADTKIQLLGSIDVRLGNLALRAQEVTDEGPEPERLFLGGTLKNPLISLQKLRKSNIRPVQDFANTRAYIQ